MRFRWISFYIDSWYHVISWSMLISWRFYIDSLCTVWFILAQPITTRLSLGNQKEWFPGILGDAISWEFILIPKKPVKLLSRRSKGLISVFNFWLILTDWKTAISDLKKSIRSNIRIFSHRRVKTYLLIRLLTFSPTSRGILDSHGPSNGHSTVK